LKPVAKTEDAWILSRIMSAVPNSLDCGSVAKQSAHKLDIRVLVLGQPSKRRKYRMIKKVVTKNEGKNSLDLPRQKF
jgi:hypothetical protein